MNARTWATVVGLSYPLFFVMLGLFIFASEHPLANGLMTALFTLGAIGAFLGTLFALGRLRLGCPFCWAPGPVVGGNKKEMYLECPSCGTVRVIIRPFRTATSSKVVADSEEDSHEAKSAP